MVKSYFKTPKIRLKGHSKEQLGQAVWERDGYKCKNPKCKGGSPLDRFPHHIKLKSQGGEDIMSNLITLCIKCHDDVHMHRISTDFINEYLEGA